MHSVLIPGQLAPDFELADQDGNPVRLSDFRDAYQVVIFFYPKDNTTGCTKEVCAFRDSFEQFRAAGAQILGISSDSIESHRRFAAKYGLPFRLLSDAAGTVRKLYGVQSTLGIIPGRATFVIARDGRLKSTFISQFRPAHHVEKSLNSV